MNLLFVVPYVPTLIRTRPYNLLRALAQRGHRLTLATLWQSEAERAELASLAKLGIEIVGAPLTRTRTYQNAVAALAAGQPLQARYCWQPALAARLAQVAPTCDLVHVEHLRGAEYGRWLQRLTSQAARPTPVVWDSVDCISLLFEQTALHSLSRLSRWMARLELPRTRRYEGSAVRAFAAVLATSARDAAALAALGEACQEPGAAPGTVKVLPNGVDSDYFVPPPALTDVPRVVLTGKMSYHANITAALTLVNEIMPHVWRERPDVQVVLAGSAPTRAVRQLAAQHAPRVRVTGHVADLRPYLQAAAVAAAPIPYGAGVQNKVLEAMACGLPVVASPQASSALQAQAGTELWVASEPVEFAAALLRLLAQPALRRQLGAAARQYAVRHHRWDRIVGALEGVYDDLIGTTNQQAH